MPYDSLIARADVAALVPEEVSQAMLTSLSATSATLALGTRIPVSRNQVRFPVLSALPSAYWVSPADTGLKETTEAAWDNKYLNIEEIAAIVPISEAVLADSAFDVWASIRPLLEAEIARTLDKAVFFGTGAPATFEDDLVTAASGAANLVTRGTAATGAGGGIFSDLSNLVATVESDGYIPSAAIANTTLRPRLRTSRDTTGQLLGDDISPSSLYGSPIQYPLPGLWPSGSGKAEMIVGDFSRLVVGVRQDMTYKVIDQGVITNAQNAIVYNLPQQDMVALRVVFRAGYAVANPINYQQSTEADRYPFGVLLSA